MKRAVLALSFCLAAAPAVAGTVELISKADPPAPPRVLGEPEGSNLSADGRWLAFSSTSPHLVPGQNDGNEGSDVFLLDRQSGSIALLSRAAGSPGNTGNAASDSPWISADGSKAAFLSRASNLAGGPPQARSTWNVYLFDRTSGSLTMVSHAAGAPLTPGNENSFLAGLSDDGGRVLFRSAATNLVPGQVDTNGQDDLFLYDADSGITSLISRNSSSAVTTASSGSFPGRLSGDGRFVLFSSAANDILAGVTDTNSTNDVFLFDASNGQLTLVSHTAGAASTTADSSSSAIDLSADGRYALVGSWSTNLVAGQTDSPFTNDLFLWDRDTGTLTLVSHVPGAATTGAGDVSGAAISSANGAFVAFGSGAETLVAGQIDNPDTQDLFLWERATGTISLVSHSAGSAVTAANSETWSFLSLSSDGRFLGFTSPATDLVAGVIDTNGGSDAFLYDRNSGTNTLVSHSAASASAAAGSESYAAVAPDGASVLFGSSTPSIGPDTNGAFDVFLFDRASGSNTALPLHGPAVGSASASGHSAAPLVSRDGRYVVFASDADDVVTGQVDGNTYYDLFLRDRVTGTTKLVSHRLGSPITAANSLTLIGPISADASSIAFLSQATDLTSETVFQDTNLFLHRRQEGTTVLVSRSAVAARDADGRSSHPALSADGRYLAFISTAPDLVAGQTDGNSQPDAYLYDRETASRLLVSRTGSNPAAPASVYQAPLGISGDGRYVTFLSASAAVVPGQVDANGTLDVFLFDRATGAATLVSRSAASPSQAGNGLSIQNLNPLSENGGYVLFASMAEDLVPGQADDNGDYDLFLFDRASGGIALVSHAAGSSTSTADGRSSSGSVSADGRFVLFSSDASDLVAGQVDTNRLSDVFLWDRLTGSTVLVSHTASSPVTTDAAAPSREGWISADGTTFAVYSLSAQLIPGQVDLNGSEDLFLFDRLAGRRRLVTRAASSPTTTANGLLSAATSNGDGSLVVFEHSASDLTADDANDSRDVFAFRNDRDLYTVAPCRLLDTRQPADGPALVSGVTETLTVAGRCGVPASARALAVNVTVTQPSGPGHLTFSPGGAPLPFASTINFAAGQTRANNAILTLNAVDGGTLAVTAAVAGNGSVHVIVDVTGYFE